MQLKVFVICTQIEIFVDSTNIIFRAEFFCHVLKIFCHNPVKIRESNIFRFKKLFLCIFC